MSRLLSADELKQWLHDGQEVALLDVREAGQFGESHLFYAIPLPYSRLELDAPRLVPRLSTRVAVVDEGAGGIAGQAAQRLVDMGYDNVAVLDGGTAAWAASGRQLFQGVNLPSKTFGELVEHRRHTPRISATELAKRLAANDNLVVLDGRPFTEYRKMNIPGAICCPNGELALRIGELAPNPDTTVVINCAGRTRSIIGAQTLIDFGVPNPVVALENGTQGWYLQDLELQHGSSRRHGDNHHPADLAQRRQQAADLAQRRGVPTLSVQQAQDWIDDPARSCFVLDVRTPEEYANGTLANAQHAPGGQLIQATDQYVGVRHARLLLIDDDGVRAAVVASWLRQMGYESALVVGGLTAALRVPPTVQPDASELVPMDAAEVAAEMTAGRLTMIDLRSSMAYRAGHAPGAQWSIRSKALSLAQQLAGPLVLMGDRGVAGLVAADMARAGLPMPRWVTGGWAAWQTAGLPQQASPDSPADAECIDYLFFVHDRHDGNKDAARRYLAWETGLLAQLDDAERAGFLLD